MRVYFQSIFKYAFVLNIYTYSSLMTDGGLGKILIKDFEKYSGLKTQVTSFGDGFQMVSQLELDTKLKRKHPDIILGFDQNTWSRVKPYAEKIGAKEITNLKAIRTFKNLEEGFVPFDYAELGFVANIKSLKQNKLEKPKHLSELLQPGWKRKFILEDPRLSTPGLFFLTWTDESHFESESYWTKLKSQWLTVTPGWSEAYSLFLKNEAPLVWSYRTSIAYHRTEKKGELYDFVYMKEGMPLQVEGAALLRPSSEEARKAGIQFLNLLLSEEIQNQISKTQWMLPVRRDIFLSEEFRDLVPKQDLTLKYLSVDDLEQVLKKWKKAISG